MRASLDRASLSVRPAPDAPFPFTGAGGTMASRILGEITVRSGTWLCYLVEILSLPEDTIHSLGLHFHDPAGSGDEMSVSLPIDSTDFSEAALEKLASDVNQRIVVGVDDRAWKCWPVRPRLRPDGVYVNQILVHGNQWRGVPPIPEGFRLPVTPDQLKLGELTREELLQTIMLAYDQ
jgi:hypothetical protein